MDLQQVINSSWGLQLAAWLARSAPTRLGYGIANLVADLFASRRRAKVIRAIRLNQWMAHDCSLEGKALDAAVHSTLRHAARSIFDLHHYIENMQASGELIRLDESAQALADMPEYGRQGLVAVGLHMSNFDLVLRWMCKRGLKPLVLTIPDPQGGRRLEYETRKRLGMNLVPASVAALRQAIKHLQQGGLVVTGMDRPIANPPACPRLFGYPAALPMHHVYLAQKANVPIRIYATILQPDGHYQVISSLLIEIQPHPDRDTEMLLNAERVLKFAETMIRQAPGQWLVPLPVWPGRMDQVPS